MSIPELFTAASSTGGQSPWAMWPFGPGPAGSVLLILSKFVFIALVLALIIFLLRWAFGPGGRFRDENSESREKALEALDMRLANGEISTEEYRERKQALLEE
ncbi:MAG: SHOCT domain-containing protein [Desulfohalobiaceae bacterium]